MEYITSSLILLMFCIVAILPNNSYGVAQPKSATCATSTHLHDSIYKLSCTNTNISIVNAELEANQNDIAFLSLAQCEADQLLNLQQHQHIVHFKWIDSDLTQQMLTKLFSNKSKHFKTLKELEISGNKLSCLEFLEQLPVGVEKLDLSHNLINFEHNYNCWQHNTANLINLEDLQLSENYLNVIPANTFQHVNELRFLNLTKTNLSNIAERSFEGTQYLKEIYLAKNQLSALPYKLFISLRMLEILDLSMNGLMEIYENMFVYNTELRVLNMERNALSEIKNHTLNNLKRLEQLHLQFNKLIDIEMNAFDSLSNLLLLNLSYNHLSYIHAGLFQPLRKLEKLDLSGNTFKELPSDVFGGQHALISLRIDYTGLMHMRNWIKHIYGILAEAKGLKRLEVLSLSYNKNLHLLAKTDLLEMAPHIKHLNFEGSNLWEIDDIGEFHDLQYLNVRGNALSTLPKSLSELKYLKYLNVRDNNLECNCKLYWLPAWLQGKRNATVLLENYNDFLHGLRCKHGNQHDVLNMLKTLHCIEPKLNNATAVPEMHALFTTAKLECSFSGIPTPYMYWSTPEDKHVHYFPNYRDPKQRYVMYENGTLFVFNVTREDSGMYTCHAKNDLGSAAGYVSLFIDPDMFYRIKIGSIICGIVAATSFLMLTLLTQGVRALLAR